MVLNPFMDFWETVGIKSRPTAYGWRQTHQSRPHSICRRPRRLLITNTTSISKTGTKSPQVSRRSSSITRSRLGRRYHWWSKSSSKSSVCIHCSRMEDGELFHSAAGPLKDSTLRLHYQQSFVRVAGNRSLVSHHTPTPSRE